MRLNVPLFLVGLSMLVASSHTVSAAPDAGVPADMQQMLPLLSSDDYAARQEAARRIQASFSRQLLALGAVTDPEALNTLANVLVTTGGEIRWLLDVLKSPDTERKAQLEFAARPGAVPLLASTFSSDQTQRIAAIHGLSGMSAPGVDLLLALLISSEDRTASVTAMEVAWDTKPTDPLVESLWRCAVEFPYTQRHALAEMVKNPQPLTFRGHAIEAFPSSPNYAHSDADSEIATDVLMHLDAPHTAALLTRFFSEAAARAGDTRATPLQLDELSGNTTAMRNALLLAVHFKVVETLPSLYVLAKLPRGGRSTFTDPRGGLNSFSNRTGAMASFLILAGLPHDGFEQRDFPRSKLRNVWVDSAQEEEDANARISDWWAAHAKAYTSR